MNNQINKTASQARPLMSCKLVSHGIITISAVLLLSFSGCCNKKTSSQAGYQTLTPNAAKHNSAAISLNTKGLEQLKAGNIDDALKSFKAALDADISYGPAHNNLGTIYYDQGELYLAAWEFQYAIRLSPSSPRPHNNLGLVYHRAGKLDKARQSFEKALELNPTSDEIKSNLNKITNQLNPKPAKAKTSQKN